ncbi:hypothetical protein HOF78_00310 [Candidatus Woesearchaeota archaeon]|jgi:hypothetical protein|nr:hypothetical protein [Candidatus Woesearchaeota archaeon]MBT6044591.1 hypothetical protein [Candidatus Woesearchaeota archaeon]
MDFYELLGNFDQIGGFDLLLPFILVFTLVFAVLQKINLFGDKKNINMIVSLVIAIFFLNNTYLIFVLQKFLPNVSIILIVFLMLLLLVGVFGGETDFKEGMLGWAFIVSLIAIGFALFSDMFSPVSGGGVSDWWYNFIGPGNMGMAWTLLFLAIFIFTITRDKKDKNEFMKYIGKGIKKLSK